MVFVSSAVENFAVFSIELGTMQPVLLVDWGDGFGRLWKIFSFFILKYLESISNVAFVTSFIFLIQFVIQIYIYSYFKLS